MDGFEGREVVVSAAEEGLYSELSTNPSLYSKADLMLSDSSSYGVESKNVSKPSADRRALCEFDPICDPPLLWFRGNAVLRATGPVMDVDVQFPDNIEDMELRMMSHCSNDAEVSRSSVMKPLGFPITRRFEWKGRDILSKCNLLASVEENLGRMPYMFSPCQNYILQIKTVAPWNEDETHDVTDLELHISVNGKDSISCKYRDFGSTILTLFGCRFLPNSRNNLLQSLGFRLLSYREKLKEKCRLSGVEYVPLWCADQDADKKLLTNSSEKRRARSNSHIGIKSDTDEHTRSSPTMSSRVLSSTFSVNDDFANRTPLHVPDTPPYLSIEMLLQELFHITRATQKNLNHLISSLVSHGVIPQSDLEDFTGVRDTDASVMRTFQDSSMLQSSSSVNVDPSLFEAVSNLKTSGVASSSSSPPPPPLPSSSSHSISSHSNGSNVSSFVHGQSAEFASRVVSGVGSFDSDESESVPLKRRHVDSQR